jgi:hypothetical protein
LLGTAEAPSFIPEQQALPEAAGAETEASFTAMTEILWSRSSELLGLPTDEQIRKIPADKASGADRQATR